MEIRIADRLIGDDRPTCIIADISANHDGELERARLLRSPSSGRRSRKRSATGSESDFCVEEMRVRGVVFGDR
jgi:hypothetical protein